MTLPRKGRRLVRVGEADFAWRIRKRPTYVQGAFQAPMTIAVQAVGADGGCVLLVDVRISRPDNWIGPHQTPVTPALVRAMVASALASGWQPCAPGGAFRHAYPLVSQG